MLTQDYERAQQLMQGIFTKNVAFNTTVFPVWIGDTHCFWYERETKDGKEYRLVDAKTATNNSAFDHSALATALSEAIGQTVDVNNLPLRRVDIDLNPSIIRFTAFDKHWIYYAETGTCTPADMTDLATVHQDCMVSPNGKQGVFIRDFNLWLRDLDDHTERALTIDGEKDYQYGVGVCCFAPIDYTNVQVRWSPDSTRLFAVQRDARQVKLFPVVHHVPQDGSIRPQLEEKAVSLPGDANVETFRLLAIDIETGRPQEANYRNIPVTRSVFAFFDSNLGWWSTDNRRAYFVDVERDYKTARVVEFDTHTGATKILFEEHSDTFIGLMLNSDEPPTLMPLPESGELLWFSERSGWAHLYLYDLETGQLKHPVTQGNWLVRDVIKVDSKRREVFVHTAGRVADWDPYYRDLCRIDLDNGEVSTVIAGNHEYCAVTQLHQNTMMAKGSGRDDRGIACGVSPSGDFAVVTRSRADEVPVSLLLNRDGKTVLELETADISGLPKNWQWPEPVKLLAADGKTDLYGLVFRPSTFSTDQSYPVISHVYNSPDLTWVSKGSFTNGAVYGMPYLDAAALAELGFIVVQIDGRGTPFRHKAFLDNCYGWSESASKIDDHIAGIQQLAKRYTYMDLNRVGITSHSSGGVGVVSSLCREDGFYKAGVASMTYDSRYFPAGLWGERYEGLSGSTADHPYPEQQISNLQGKLLLMNSMIDPLAPAEGTLRIIDALQTANKDFDLLLLPNPAYGYTVKRAWDYLVEHLLGLEPPEDFKLTTSFD
ncbi:Prolyl tripeptidyl peptidase precursor [Gammaproteobacteria bacterium MOLA455]|nr:Prolyl tripeptidyl peptidase precursor [Gammaproteobacteria bacterium MOLA455]